MTETTTDLITEEMLEAARRSRQAELNSDAAARILLQERHGRVWDTNELGQDFKVEGFAAPFVIVERKADGERGSLEFQHSPRFYFNFESKAA
jgi:hypothetical protein